MLRRLLTLLAVISGLALAEGPAVAAHVDVVAMAQAADAAECQLSGARPAEMRQSAAARASDPIPFLTPVAGYRAPTVLLQIDRAHE